MTTIKITSNPYKREIRYYAMCDNDDVWNEITAEENPRSTLVSKQMTEGFFPFIADRVVDALIREYGEFGQKLNIVFEGVCDEYDDLEKICGEERFKDKVEISHSNIILENARDILPDVISKCKSISPLIYQSVGDKNEINNDLNKFEEVSSNIIPICVWGNYSSGKSTFINALIGSEILPSGDNPVTARVYKIEKSKWSDKATVEFINGSDDIQIRIENGGHRWLCGRPSNDLTKEIESRLSEYENAGISRKVSCILEIINPIDTISDLVTVSVPFGDNGINCEYGEIVIFDTPGSNSASNERHFDVLRNAIASFSNGLPVFVTERDKLDSTDNEKLYEIINGMSELDSRFTMIIANKADSASLPREGYSESDIDRIKHEAVPRSLNSQGIFFVSSILGLGSKCGGNLDDEHYDEVFSEKQVKYTDPSSKYYKSLYKYNILPPYEKLKLDTESGKCSNLIYANSGLCAVEYCMSNFVNRYSAYNKCKQSLTYLSKLMEVTTSEIRKRTEEKERSKDERSKDLEKGKNAAINLLENTANALMDSYLSEYYQLRESVVRETYSKCRINNIGKWEIDKREERESEFNIVLKENEAKEYLKNIGKNFTANAVNAIKSRTTEALRFTADEVANDVKMTFNKNVEIINDRIAINNEVSDDILATAADEVKKMTEEVAESFMYKSKNYLEGRFSELQRKLIDAINGADTLTIEKKKLLSSIVLKYKVVAPEIKTDNVFKRSEFNSRIVKDGRIDISKLGRKVNREIVRINDISIREIYEAQRRSVKGWKEDLLLLICENILDFDPELKKKSELIRKEELEIFELKTREEKINNYYSQIQEMMQWKEDRR